MLTFGFEFDNWQLCIQSPMKISAFANILCSAPIYLSNISFNNFGYKCAMIGTNTQSFVSLTTMFWKVNAVCHSVWRLELSAFLVAHGVGRMVNLVIQVRFGIVPNFSVCCNLLLSVVILFKYFVVLATLLGKLLGERELGNFF